MTEVRKPRAFLSYRHAESADDDQLNIQHRAWVSQLAEDLTADGIQIVWDRDIQAGLSHHGSIDPFELALCQEFSRALPAICNTFVPVITPAYLERIGVINGKVESTIPYGVVFEEWQGAGWLVSKRLLDLVLIIRRGEEHQLNLSGLVPFLTRQDAIIDFRGDDPQRYLAQIDRLATELLEVDLFQNPLSVVEIQLWCDVYVDWCRMKFPPRALLPVDIWFFDTSAANQFLGEVGTLFRTVEFETLAINSCLKVWQSELRSTVAKSEYRIQYADLIELTSLALSAQHGKFGWQRLAKAAEFCSTALKIMSFKGDAVERAKALNNTGQVFLRLAKRKSEAAGFQSAIELFRSGLDELFSQKQSQEWLTIQHSLADALKCWGEVENNHVRLSEAKLQYELIARISDEIGYINRGDAARAAANEINARLNL